MARAGRILAALIAEPHRTMASIAQEIGVTREYVRQIALQLGQDGKSRKAPKQPKERRFSVLKFAHRMKLWLREAGYGYCGLSTHIGGRVVPIHVMAKWRSGCSLCMAKYAMEIYHRNPERAREWQRKNSQKVATYSARWRAKLSPERRREVNRRNYEQKRARKQREESCS